jgi:hypothetical protein
VETGVFPRVRGVVVESRRVAVQRKFVSRMLVEWRNYGREGRSPHAECVSFSQLLRPRKESWHAYEKESIAPVNGKGVRLVHGIGVIEATT